MKLKLFFLFSFFISNFSFSQEIQRKGAHQQQLEELGILKKRYPSSKTQNTTIIPLLTTSTNTLSKMVFGFLPYWEYSSGAHSNMHYNLLSHIAIFNFETSSSGMLTNPSNWPWTDVINEAHSNGTKVIMVVNNFSQSEIHTLLTNSSSRNTLFSNIKNTIITYQLDGVNIDFEGLASSDRGSLLNGFLLELTNYIHANLPGKEVSFDGPAVNWGGWNLNGLVESVDQVFIMAYDYNGSWSSNTGAVAPLVDPSGGISVSKSLNNDYSTAIANHPEKLILGIPYYGKHWETSTSVAGSSINTYIGSTFYKNTVTEAETYGGFIWDANSQTSWYKWFESSKWNQVWADNEQSITLKYDKAIEKNLGGIGIWALNYDANRNELWDLINTKFNTLTVDDSFLKKQIKLYPNPTTEYLTILNINNIPIVSYMIFNVSGQRIKLGKPIINKIDVKHLKKGIYFVKITDNKGSQGVFKIIKI